MNTNYHSKVVAQIIDALESVDEVSYAQKIEVLHNNSLGQHFRHILEFYLCLFEAKSCGIVNYDNRKRDLSIETDKSYAQVVARTIQTQLETIDISTEIGLETSLGSDTAIVPSNFSRELIYLSEHTIHHFALIKIGISTSFPSVKLCENFGVAESTIVYKQQQGK